jgi:hypothetical protein
MRLVKHNYIENFNDFSQEEREDLLMQEITKAMLLFPNAFKDVFDICEVQYKSTDTNELAQVILDNNKNLKLINRVVRLSILVNKDGSGDLKHLNRNSSYRQIMSSGKSFLKEHHEIVKESVSTFREMFKQENYSELLNENVKSYLNLDGQTEEQDEEPTKTVTTGFSFKPILVVALIGVVGYILYKKYGGKTIQ